MQNSNVTDEWIIENVSSNIALLCPKQGSVVLGRALLWDIFDEDMSKILPASMVDRVKRLMRSLDPNMIEHVNPIKKCL